MTKSSKLPATSTLHRLFGPPPLITGERAEDYNKLLDRIFRDVKPTDTIEEILVRDVVDLTWETFRLRRLKASLLEVNLHKGLAMVLEPRLAWSDADVMEPTPDSDELSESWAARDPNAIKKTEALLASAGLTMDAVMAQTLAAEIDHVDRIDRMIMSAETRRHVALREIDRHRAVLGERLRRATQDIEDADFKVIAAKDEKETRAA
jgi:hypothetical protein